MTPTLTPYQSCQRLIDNDRRNIEYVRHAPQHRAEVIADCAARMLQALGLEDEELERQAEENLRAALEGWRT